MLLYQHSLRGVQRSWGHTGPKQALTSEDRSVLGGREQSGVSRACGLVGGSQDLPLAHAAGWCRHSMGSAVGADVARDPRG